jgi:heme exporter protein D
VWLLVAPSALAYQPEGADWADPTFVDFWTGLPLTVVSIVGLILHSLGLAKELRNRGILRRRTYEDAPARDMGARTVASQRQSDVEQSLVPLMAAMLQDMQEQRQRREAPNSEGAPGGIAHNEYPVHGDREAQSERRTRQ